MLNNEERNAGELMPASPDKARELGEEEASSR